MFKKIFISCTNAKIICDKNQYKEARFLSKLTLIFHHFLCKKCRTYSKHNTLLTRFISKFFILNDQESNLTTKEKKEIQTKVDYQLQEK